MRPVIVTHVFPQYRVAALNALKAIHPGTTVIASTGGSWACGQNAMGLELREDARVLAAKVLKLGPVSIILMPGLRRTVREVKADVLLLDPRMGLLSVWLLAVFPVRLTGKRVPTVWWFAGWQNRERSPLVYSVAEWIQRRVYRRGTGAACYSTRALQYARVLGVPASTTILAQNATDTAALSAAYDRIPGAGSAREGFNLLYVGSVDSRKMLVNVVDALAVLTPEFAIGLRIVGDGTARSGILERARERGVELKVSVFEGTHEPESLAEHLAWADVGILPNQGGLFLNTAMSCGVPVICGRADGTEDDLVVDGLTGWRMPDGRPETIAAALSRVFADRHLIENVGRQARLHYEETATIRNMVDGIDAALRAAVAAGRERTR